jgi:hypothetical protein
MRTVKECLRALAEKNVDMNINRTIMVLCENFDEQQLEYKLSQGVVIDNQIINLYFYKNMGFKCNNSMVERHGNLPICNYIEKRLNETYKLPSSMKGTKRVEFPFIFDHTLYRVPTDEELKEFEKYPELTPKQILNEFTYTLVGRGILNFENKSQIVESIQNLSDLYPEDTRYEEALELARNLKRKF